MKHFHVVARIEAKPGSELTKTRGAMSRPWPDPPSPGWLEASGNASIDLDKAGSRSAILVDQPTGKAAVCEKLVATRSKWMFQKAPACGNEGVAANIGKAGRTANSEPRALRRSREQPIRRTRRAVRIPSDTGAFSDFLGLLIDPAYG
jgi:hypothetical protein